MKKMLSFGLAAILAMSIGCSKSDNTPAVTTSQEVSTVEATSTEQEEVVEITADDFKPFVEALYGYSEDTLMTLNENNDINYVGYGDNLNTYKKEIKNGIGKYFTKELLQQLDKQQNKLELDIPKKVLVNGYVADAVGKIEKIEIKSIREIGENKIYELAITSINNVQPENDFYKTYSWNKERGYYIKSAIAIQEGVVSTASTDGTFMYAKQPSVTDKIKLVNHYWVEIHEEETVNGSPFAIASLRQAGGFDVPQDDKGWIFNTQYVERLPYYEEVTDVQKRLILKAFSSLFSQPRETYYYYEKIMDANFEYYQTFWRDLNLTDSITLDEKNYKSTFATTINPYKDNTIEVSLNDKNIVVTPSIYSSQLQPTFIVTLPVKALLRDNSVVYYNYKYFVSTESNKIEAIQFMKMEKITEADYTTELDKAEDNSVTTGEVAPITEGETIPATQ